MSAAAAIIPIIQALQIPLLLFGIAFAAGSLSNLFGSVTGHNPMAELSTTMMNSMVPLMVTLMPMVMIMNLMFNMVNSLFAPITRPMMMGVY